MIAQTVTTPFKADVLKGIHNLDADMFRLALYAAPADLGVNTVAYTTMDKVTGTGCVASFTSRSALIYNSSKANRAVAVLDFDAGKTAAATFTAQVPPNTVTSALIRFS